LLKQIVRRFTQRQHRQHLADEHTRTAAYAREVSRISRVHAYFPRVEPNLDKHTDTLHIYRLIASISVRFFKTRVTPHLLLLNREAHQKHLQR
jgi:hypothetical protein